MSVHFVSVTPSAPNEDGWREPATVTFECRGNRHSKCHSYPDCDCEFWEDGHEQEHLFVKHDECWMQGWFESEAGAVYNGPDAVDWDDSGVPRDMNLSGPITAAFDMGGFVAWEFTK